jgi:hypothetical protein
MSGFFSKVGRWSLSVHQAPRHPYQQVYGSSIVRALHSYERAPRLEVQGEGYGSEQRLMPLPACLKRIGDSVPHRLPVPPQPEAPPDEAEMERLAAIGARYGAEILGPPPGQ